MKWNEKKTDEERNGSKTESAGEEKNIAKPTNCSRTHMPWRLCYMRFGTYSFLKLYTAPHIARRLLRIECVVSLTGSRVEEEKKRVGARRRWMNSRIVAAAWHSTVGLVWVSADLVYCCFTYILIWMINFRARRIYDCRRRDLLSFPVFFGFAAGATVSQSQPSRKNRPEKYITTKNERKKSSRI